MNIKNTFLELAPWLGRSAHRGDLRGSQRKALGFQSCQGLAGTEEERGGRKVAVIVPITDSCLPLTEP